MTIEALRARLMSSLAVALGVGCGPSVEPSDGSEGLGSTSSTPDEGPASIGATSSATSSAISTSTSGPTTTTDADADADADSSMEQPRPDVGEIPPPPEGCVPQPRPPATECTAELPAGGEFEFFCIELPAGQTCEEWMQGFVSTPEWDELVSACFQHNGEWCPTLLTAIGCGPLPDFGDQCCAWFIAVPPRCPPEGRPFVIDGSERLAGLVERNGWADVAGDTVTTVPLPPDHRAAIAAAWAEQALAEHASIASFARFTLQLLACGAPASLVSAAQVALGEEIEHARLFFALASHFAGRPLGPTALAMEGALTGSDDFDEVVLATVREGCIAETLSAWRITLAARSARDPSLAAALARVAAQEQEHAALAWRFVAWALPRATPSLRDRIAATLHDAARFAPRAPTLAAQVPDREWRAHGLVPLSEHAAATEHALRELVAPLGHTLLGALPVPARTSTTTTTATG